MRSLSRPLLTPKAYTCKPFGVKQITQFNKVGLIFNAICVAGMEKSPFLCGVKRNKIVT
nr:MAG TPA: hypothetical protein [Caudoviricetes sp.]